MKIYNEKQTVIITETFLDENDIPLDLKKGYPKAKLWLDKELITVLNPEPTGVPGEYSVQVTIPEFGFVEATPITLRWYAREKDGSKNKHDVALMIQPASRPEVGDLVLMHDELTATFILPAHLAANSQPNLSIYLNNEKIYEEKIADTQINRKATYSEVSFTHQIPASLEMHLMVVEYTSFDDRKERHMQNLWIVTPQILNAVNMLESFVNKARIDNVIPQLEYTQAGMLTNLHRGLGLFNGFQPTFTEFTGTNMQGLLLDVFVLCGSYYALAEQLLAEGMLAFDFTGQAVTLNVDRTPAIESALGRIEQQMQERIPVVKRQLVKAGIYNGDGSNTTPSSSGLGRTLLSNSPTTSRNVWRPGMQHYYR